MLILQINTVIGAAVVLFKHCVHLKMILSSAAAIAHKQTEQCLDAASCSLLIC
jgi:hypothetical protein